MNTWVRRTARVGVFAAGFLLAAGATAASAHLVANHDAGAGNANQVPVVAQLPTNASGNAASSLGDAVGMAHGSGADATSGFSGPLVANEDPGSLNANQVPVLYQEPTNMSGNAVTSAGRAIGVAKGSSADATSGDFTSNLVANHDAGAGNANQVPQVYQVPTLVNGNGVAAPGVAAGLSKNSGAGAQTESAEMGGSEGGLVANHNPGVLNANQVPVLVQAPINVAGNGVGVLGTGVGVAKGSSATADASGFPGSLTANHNPGAGNANQVPVVVQTPINISGNGVGVLGDGVGVADCSGADASTGGTESAEALPVSAAAVSPATLGGVTGALPATESAEEGGLVANHNPGVLNANQVPVLVQAPINVAGNGVGVLGTGVGVAKGSSATADASGFPGSLTANGNPGSLNANQVPVDVQAPINMSGNGVGVLGDGVGVADCSGADASA